MRGGRQTKPNSGTGSLVIRCSSGSTTPNQGHQTCHRLTPSSQIYIIGASAGLSATTCSFVMMTGTAGFSVISRARASTFCVELGFRNHAVHKAGGLGCRGSHPMPLSPENQAGCPLACRRRPRSGLRIQPGPAPVARTQSRCSAKNASVRSLASFALSAS